MNLMVDPSIRGGSITTIHYHYHLHSILEDVILYECRLLWFRILCTVVNETPVTLENFLVFNIALIVTSSRTAASTASFLTGFDIFRFLFATEPFCRILLLILGLLFHIDRV